MRMAAAGAEMMEAAGDLEMAEEVAADLETAAEAAARATRKLCRYQFQTCRRRLAGRHSGNMSDRTGH